MKLNYKAIIFALVGFFLGGLIGSFLGIAEILGLFLGLLGYLVGHGLKDTKSAGKADSETATHAKSMVPAQGRGSLYIVRTGFIAKLAGMKTTVKGADVSQTAQMKAGEFASLDLAPGDYTVETDMVSTVGKPATMDVSIAANKTVVIVATIKLSNDVELTLAGNDEATKKLIGKSKMILLEEA